MKTKIDLLYLHNIYMFTLHFVALKVFVCYDLDCEVASVLFSYRWPFVFMMQSLNKTRVCVSLEEFRLACQCPICQETFQEPVTLTCENCFKNLPIVDRLRFQCASCRKVYKASVKEDLKPAIDLQVNFCKILINQLLFKRIISACHRDLPQN